MIKRRATEPLRLADSKATPREGQRLAGSARGERVLLVVLIFIFAVIGFIPGWRHLNSDFSNYYVVAHLYREGYPLERVYEWIWFQRHADSSGIDRRLVSYIPLTLPS